MTTGHLELGRCSWSLRILSAYINSRRICPGIHFAEREIFLAVVHMLWAFNIEAVSGEQNVRKTRERTLGGHSILKHEIRMVPRFENVSDVLDL